MITVIVVRFYVRARAITKFEKSIGKTWGKWYIPLVPDLPSIFQIAFSETGWIRENVPNRPETVNLLSPTYL